MENDCAHRTAVSSLLWVLLMLCSWCRAASTLVSTDQRWKLRAITRSADLLPNPASNLDDKHLFFILITSLYFCSAGVFSPVIDPVSLCGTGSFMLWPSVTLFTGGGLFRCTDDVIAHATSWSHYKSPIKNTQRSRLSQKNICCKLFGPR